MTRRKRHFIIVVGGGSCVEKKKIKKERQHRVTRQSDPEGQNVIAIGCGNKRAIARVNVERSTESHREIFSFRSLS